MKLQMMELKINNLSRNSEPKYYNTSVDKESTPYGKMKIPRKFKVRSNLLKK